MEKTDHQYRQGDSQVTVLTWIDPQMHCFQQGKSVAIQKSPSFPIWA